MKILDVGNSFSQDAMTFLHQAAATQGLDLTAVNLFLGGCSLETHWKNWENDTPAYDYELNGRPTGRTVSIREALEEGGWDWIAMQQVSQDSGWQDTYEPFLTQLLEVFRAFAPDARLCLHETWAYEKDSGHGGFARYRRDQAEMYERLRACYAAQAQKHGLVLIPCGDVIQALRGTAPFDVSRGGRSLCRDGFHMSYGYGRYALACTWLRRLFGLDMVRNTYRPESEEQVEETALSLIRETVDATVVKAAQASRTGCAGSADRQA